MIQNFKGDDTELKFKNSANEIYQDISTNLDSMFDDLYNCYHFGDMLWESQRTPLSKAILKRIFRESFFTIFSNFLVSGSFESYITVFKSIFGDDTTITFTVPGPGQLEIDIVATGLQIDSFIVREIIENEYVFDELIDQDSDNIVFQSVKGFESQYELEQMLKELLPAGIFVDITLTRGGE